MSGEHTAQRLLYIIGPNIIPYGYCMIGHANPVAMAMRGTEGALAQVMVEEVHIEIKEGSGCRKPSGQ